jgi:hypothetical protein
MRRAAALPSAGEILFVDTTSSVNADGVSVTLMLSATSAGAIPLCVLMHIGQSEEVCDVCRMFIDYQLANNFNIQTFQVACQKESLISETF